jgi:undecaprenyl diphosphate synthase
MGPHGLIETERKVPEHVAVIMDGNGRWAEKHGLPRTEGHRVGAGRVREIVEKCLEIGVKYFTIYAFSKENWKRPGKEVSAIMKLSEVFFRREFNRLKNKGVFFVHLGDRDNLPPFVIKIIENMERNNAAERKLYLNIAFNYSGRSELTYAFKKLCTHVLQDEIKVSDITEDKIEHFLFTHGMPDPDLLIRTGGEMRVSNFLLWQIAYTEIWVTDVLWPDFSADVFLEAISDYRRRERRFGGVR